MFISSFFLIKSISIFHLYYVFLFYSCHLLNKQENQTQRCLEGQFLNQKACLFFALLLYFYIHTIFTQFLLCHPLLHDIVKLLCDLHLFTYLYYVFTKRYFWGLVSFVMLTRIINNIKIPCCKRVCLDNIVIT